MGMIQIDMPIPESCVECRFSQGGYMYCHAMPENFCGYVNYCEENGRPEWCPLKALESRVMTLDEYKAIAERPLEERVPVWLEWRGGSGRWTIPERAYQGYGVNWRCWTGKPSAEEREAMGNT